VKFEMKNQNNLRWLSFLLATIATIFLSSGMTVTFSQDAQKFKVGDRVKTPDHATPATVVKIESGWLTVKYDDMSGEYEVMLSGKLTLLDANDKPAADATAMPRNETKKNGRER
jgi:hypothetical protein